MIVELVTNSELIRFGTFENLNQALSFANGMYTFIQDSNTINVIEKDNILVSFVKR